jgi:flagellar capping protein FliD
LTSNALGAQAAVTPLINTVQDTTNATGGSATVASFNAGATTLGTDFVGGSATFAANGKTFTYTGDGTTTTFANLATALSQSDLGVTASFSNHVLTVTSATNSSTAITMTPGGSPLTDEDLAGTPTTPPERRCKQPS